MNYRCNGYQGLLRALTGAHGAKAVNYSEFKAACKRFDIGTNDQVFARLFDVLYELMILY